MARRTIAERNSGLLDQIRAAINEIEPAAGIILYGSRARGDAEAGSDWDLLVLLDGPVDYARATDVRHRLYDLELARDDCPVLSAIVRSKEEWESPLYRAMPFHANVEREGLEV
jgi:predicted nucleotidyltransferase